MENSNTFADIYGNIWKGFKAEDTAELTIPVAAHLLPEPEPEKTLLTEVKDQTLLKVVGAEGLSLGESFNLFFKDFSRVIDNRMATLSRSIHEVNMAPTQKYLKENMVLYVRNTATPILTPQNYSVGFGNMAAHATQVVNSIYLINSLKTEATRLYDWIKQVIKRGRIDRSFQWSITDFDRAIDAAENFLRNLPEGDRQRTYTLGEVYVNFEEAFGIINEFNHVSKTLKARDVEMTAKELNNVYEIGQLLIAKIKNNDIMVKESGILDIEMVINRFIRLTNICGSMMVLLNELSAVLDAQLKTLQTLK